MITTLNTPAIAVEKGGNAAAIVTAIAILAAAGYYFLIYKPEQEAKEKLK